MGDFIGLPLGDDWRLVGAICLAAVLVPATAVYLMRYFGLGRKGRMLELALNNMTQGVVMFDAPGRLVVCNKRYLELYGLPANVVKPGAKLEDIVRLRAQSGTLPGDSD